VGAEEDADASVGVHGMGSAGRRRVRPFAAGEISCEGVGVVVVVVVIVVRGTPIGGGLLLGGGRC